jgi:hypothetical protein
MKLVFHIGMAKTGSTALQNALSASTGYLAEHGVLYPIDPSQPELNNHRLFATLVAPPEQLPRHMARLGDAAEVADRRARLLASIGSQIAERRPELLLMSSETMFTKIRDAYAPGLRAALAGFGAEPRFVAYVRRPSDRYVSGLQQHLKASATVPAPTPSHYRRNVTSYETVFGQGCLALHLFHRSALEGGDVVKDFATRYLAGHGVDPAGLAQVGEVNVSLGAESMLLMQAYRARFHAGSDNQRARDSERLRRRLREADEAVGAGKPRLRPEIAETVDYVSDDPLWLRDRFGIEFPDFDYARLEAGRLARPLPAPATLAQIVLTDPARLAAVLDHLAAGKWAQRRPRRLNWVAEMRRLLVDEARPEAALAGA